MSIISILPSFQPRPTHTHARTRTEARREATGRVFSGEARDHVPWLCHRARIAYTEQPRAPANRRETDQHALAQRGRGLQRAAHAESFHHRFRSQDGHHAVDDPQDSHRYEAPRSRELQLGDRAVGRLSVP